MGGVFEKASRAVSLPMPVDVSEIAQNAAVNPLGIVQDIATRFQGGRDTIASLADGTISAGFNTAAGLFSMPVNAATAGLYSIEHPLGNTAVAAPDVLTETASVALQTGANMPTHKDVWNFSNEFAKEAPNAFNSPQKIGGAVTTLADGFALGKGSQIAGLVGGVGSALGHTLRTGERFNTERALGGYERTSGFIDELLENYERTSPFMHEALNRAGNLSLVAVPFLGKASPVKKVGRGIATKGFSGAGASILEYAGTDISGLEMFGNALRGGLLNIATKGAGARAKRLGKLNSQAGVAVDALSTLTGQGLSRTLKSDSTDNHIIETFKNNYEEKLRNERWAEDIAKRGLAKDK